MVARFLCSDPPTAATESSAAQDWTATRDLIWIEMKEWLERTELDGGGLELSMPLRFNRVSFFGESKGSGWRASTTPLWKRLIQDLPLDEEPLDDAAPSNEMLAGLGFIRTANMVVILSAAAVLTIRALANNGRQYLYTPVYVPSETDKLCLELLGQLNGRIVEIKMHRRRLAQVFANVIPQQCPCPRISSLPDPPRISPLSDPTRLSLMSDPPVSPDRTLTGRRAPLPSQLPVHVGAIEGVVAAASVSFDANDRATVMPFDLAGLPLVDAQSDAIDECATYVGSLLLAMLRDRALVGLVARLAVPEMMPAARYPQPDLAASLNWETCHFRHAIQSTRHTDLRVSRLTGINRAARADAMADALQDPKGPKNVQTGGFVIIDECGQARSVRTLPPAGTEAAFRSILFNAHKENALRLPRRHGIISDPVAEPAAACAAAITASTGKASPDTASADTAGAARQEKSTEGNRQALCGQGQVLDKVTEDEVSWRIAHGAVGARATDVLLASARGRTEAGGEGEATAMANTREMHGTEWPGWPDDMNVYPHPRGYAFALLIGAANSFAGALHRFLWACPPQLHLGTWSLYLSDLQSGVMQNLNRAMATPLVQTDGGAIFAIRMWPRYEEFINSIVALVVAEQMLNLPP
jgi:hypothetical protein